MREIIDFLKPEKRFWKALILAMIIGFIFWNGLTIDIGEQGSKNFIHFHLNALKDIFHEQ